MLSIVNACQVSMAFDQALGKQISRVIGHDWFCMCIPIRSVIFGIIAERKLAH